MSHPLTTAMKPCGFTLVEVMVTVAVVALLAQLAYPSYVGHVLRAKRIECRSAVMQAMQQQERHYTQHNSYLAYASSAAVNLKTFSGDTLAGSACTLSAGPCSGALALSVCVTVTGSPQHTDTEVGAIHLRSDGAKGCSGSHPEKCWK